MQALYHAAQAELMTLLINWLYAATQKQTRDEDGKTFPVMEHFAHCRDAVATTENGLRQHPCTAPALQAFPDIPHCSSVSFDEKNLAEMSQRL